jgi:serine/threonine-protein kinase RsbW
MSANGRIDRLQRFPHNVDAPRAARDMAAELLADLGNGADRADDLAVVVSELVTNAIVHGPDADLELRLHASPALIRVEVSDEGTTPFQWPADGVALHRGLCLVGVLSERCGVSHGPSTLAWCEFDLA